MAMQVQDVLRDNEERKRSHRGEKASPFSKERVTKTIHPDVGTTRMYFSHNVFFFFFFNNIQEVSSTVPLR